MQKQRIEILAIQPQILCCQLKTLQVAPKLVYYLTLILTKLTNVSCVRHHTRLIPLNDLSPVVRRVAGFRRTHRSDSNVHA